MPDRDKDGDWPLMELVAMVAFTMLIAYGLHQFGAPAPLSMQTSYIVPSQTVRW